VGWGRKRKPCWYRPWWCNVMCVSVSVCVWWDCYPIKRIASRLNVQLYSCAQNEEGKSPEPSPPLSTRQLHGHDEDVDSGMSSYKMIKLVKVMVYTFCAIHLADLMTTGKQCMRSVRWL
jgi:hypothetical protein